MKFFSTATQITQAFKNAGRVREILGVLVSHGFADLVHRMKLSRFLPTRYTEIPRLQQVPFAERLRRSFEELGPTFVKLGQLLATRPDLIPEPVVEELQKLQDAVVGVPYKEIQRALEMEWKRPLTDIFSEFEETPMAAASIAQVHGAVLKTGERVAVKIQRPGIAPVIHNDISILRGLAQLMDRYIPESRPFNPRGLVEEFFHTILEELDFRVESNNIRKIKSNLTVFERIRIPRVHEEVSTNRVLVLERFDGIRFSDREAIIGAGIKPSDIVELGSDVFFHMVMMDGLFHGDLHPGNLFVLPDGHIGIIDFGIVGRLSRKVQDSILILFTSLIEEDYETLAFEYINLCNPSGATDIHRLQKDLMDTISPYVGMSLGELNAGRLLLRSTSIAVRHRLQVPRELMLLFKAMVTIEAMGKKLEPNFDIMQVGTKLAKKVLTSRYSKERVMRDFLVIGRDTQGLIENLPRLLKRFLRVWSQNNFAFETRSPETADLSLSVKLLAHTWVVSTLSTALFALGIVFLIQDRDPQILGLPVTAAISLGISFVVLVRTMMILGKRIK